MNIKHIVLVDDHVIVRNGLKELIEKIGPFLITQQFDNGEELLSSLPFKEQVDLIILDLNLKDMPGDAVVMALAEQNCTTPVLILTLSADENVIVNLFRNGVRGYLQKDCSAQELKTAIEEIFRVGYYHNEFLALSLRSNGTTPKKTEQEKILEALTPREREFLKLVCHEKEYTYEQIADQMKVQHRTVDGYRQEVFEKFGIKSKTGLVLFVLKHNLMSVL